MVIINKGKVLLSYKQFMILKGLQNLKYMSEAMRYSDVAFSYISIVTDFFLQLELIKVGKITGNKKEILLTTKGSEVLEIYIRVYNLLNNEKN